MVTFSSMFNWLTLDNNQKVTNWISTGVSPDKTLNTNNI